MLTCSFAVSYENADIGRYYLGPILIAWAWVAMLAKAMIDWLERAFQMAPVASVGCGDAARHGRAAAALALPVAAMLLLPTALAIPTRLVAVDESLDRSAADWTDFAFDAMQPDAIIVSWWSYSTPLWYAQRVEGRRPDVMIVDDRTRLDAGLGELNDVIDANLGSRPVYVIRSDPAEVAALSARYRLRPLDGPVGFRLTLVVSRLGTGS